MPSAAVHVCLSVWSLASAINIPRCSTSMVTVAFIFTLLQSFLLVYYPNRHVVTSDVVAFVHLLSMSLLFLYCCIIPPSQFVYIVMLFVCMTMPDVVKCLTASQTSSSSLSYNSNEPVITRPRVERSGTQLTAQPRVGRGESTYSVHGQANLQGTLTECCICLEQLVPGQRILALPCAHPFHEHCVTEWLKYSEACPLCNSVVSLTA
jgi:hypothetical protein